MKKPSDLPPLWCDFNACGWSGRPDDNCYYSLDKVRVEEFKAGDRVFLYDVDLVDGAMGVIGIDAELIEDRSGLIARPLGDAFYSGPKFW
jgi:hypothetical protein